ncbi:MAG TPA: erythromycin esterase family protein [Vicinamibacterales bacterium]|nr:erythromycin esterase family protein [Vicinamibacterales bacterium]
MLFKDRVDAGRQLAKKLAKYAGHQDVVVFALPRGGVPVGAEVARALGAPFDVFLVRKLGVPGHPELAMGAIAEGGVEVLSDHLIHDIGIPEAAIRQVAVRERLELDRRDTLYRQGRPRPPVRGHVVIVVDDGLATGASMQAAVLALRKLEPSRIVVAAPVGAMETCERLRHVADDVVCASTPEPFQAVGLWYERFDQTTDEEVRQLLARPFESDDPVVLIRRHAIELSGDAHDYDALLDAIGEARVVMIGEASHGTHEFYRERALITRRLIAEKGFAAVAVEADWPDAYRVNRYVRGLGTDQDAVESLGDFERFPMWMWRNADVLDFIGWLRAHNDTLPGDRRAGFYGLDLYSLRASIQAVLTYLSRVDPDAARRARQRYGCFDQFGDEMQQYGYSAAFGLTPSCEREVLAQLVELQRQRSAYATRDGQVAADEFFFASQNARLVRNAEEYYRTMFKGRVESWNLRDEHMAETVHALIAFLDQRQAGARVVLWAHNSHLGDARATDMGHSGELNLGQLVREHFGAAAVNIGFTTHTGTVTAASEWDAPPERKHVRPSLAGSYERVFHEAGIRRFLLPLSRDAALASALTGPHLERAIGVLYVPRTERQSHYFHTRLADQFDFVIHIDETRAVEPLERSAGWEAGEMAETYPSGL